ncbi:multidrug resistance protein, MATE family [Amycolatopsis rubida]|uniref:Probable multidrug resistance protein NorM n=2 Tax=Amycolatopsis rubida TaxID=112413 RepID=A0A1I5HQC6_9PSEU|nr:multidrug resistance protein, MATE family [Amycolatopsis rubida]
MLLTRWLAGCRPLIAVSMPIAGIQLAQVALTTTDLAMLGGMSVRAIAAGGLALTLYNQVRTMCVGTVTAVGNLVAGAAGRGETRAGDDRLDEQASTEVRDIVRASFLVATAVGVLAALVLIALGYVLAWFGQDAEVLALARPTMLALAPGLIPMLWLNVLRQFAVGMRRPGSLLGVTIVSVGVNILLDGGFGYGWFGFPELGAPGVGLATTIVQFLNCFAFLLILRRDEYLAPLLSVGFRRRELPMAREILRLGIPISLTYGSEAGITSVATVLMGSFGPATLAAQSVVNQLVYIVYQLNIGLSQGSSILISRAVSRHDRPEVSRIARQALSLSVSAMTVAGLAYLVVPGWVLGLFLEKHPPPEVLSLAHTLLFFGIAQQYLKGAQNVCVGLLRGLGNTKSGFRATLLGYWVIGIPVMVLCGFGLSLAGPGVWLGLCFGFGATAVLLLRKFSRELASTPALSAVPGRT